MGLINGAMGKRNSVAAITKVNKPLDNFATARWRVKNAKSPWRGADAGSGFPYSVGIG
jgi:hypothetical protein